MLQYEEDKVGFQWGGQAYSEVLFFKNAEALESFKDSELEFSGQISSVAVTKEPLPV